MLLSVLLVLAGATYAAWRALPVYLVALRVDEALRSEIGRTYRASRLGEPARSNEERALVDDARNKVAALGITDPELAVTLEYIGEQAVLRCDYRVEIVHPYVLRPTVLTFHRRVQTSLRPTDWQ